MSLETELVAALDPLFPGKVYADTVDIFDPSDPYCIYQVIGGTIVTTFCGPADRQNRLVQFTVWGDERSEVNTIMASMGAVLTAAPLYGVPTGGMRSLFDESTRLRGAQQDYSFWY